MLSWELRGRNPWISFVVCLALLQPCGLSPVSLLYPWDFSGQHYWSGLLFPPPGDLPDPGIEPVSLHLLHCPPLYHWASPVHGLDTHEQPTRSINNGHWQVGWATKLSFSGRVRELVPRLAFIYNLIIPLLCSFVCVGFVCDMIDSSGISTTEVLLHS